MHGMRQKPKVSPRGAYRAGANFERRVMAVLVEAGYTAIRSAGSKGVFDLVAVKPGEVLFVQVKRNGVIGPEAWNSLVGWSCGSGAIPILAVRDAISKHIVLWKLTGPRKPWARSIPRVRFLVADEVADELGGSASAAKIP